MLQNELTNMIAKAEQAKRRQAGLSHSLLKVRGLFQSKILKVVFFVAAIDHVTVCYELVCLKDDMYSFVYF